MAQNILDELKTLSSENSLTTILEGLQEISSSDDTNIKDALVSGLSTNRYEASDEGKVVHNGALVAQTAHAKVIENGTIDTTTNNSVEVEVPNPNSLVTVSGTLADPWGEVDYAQLVADIVSNDATAILSVPTMSSVTFLHSNNSYLSANGTSFDLIDEQPVLNVAALMQYAVDGTLRKILMWQNGTVADMTTLLSAAETTLTIIHHPIPSSET